MEGETEMLVSKSCDASASRCAIEKSDLHEIWLVHVLQGNCLLADGCRQRFQTYGTAVVELDDALKHSSVNVVKSQSVDLKLGERVIGNLGIDGAVSHDLCEVTHALEQTVGNSGGFRASGLRSPSRRRR